MSSALGIRFVTGPLHVQVGQVILTYPYQMALMGIIPAVIVGVGVGLLNFFTLWLLVILYLERKRFMVSRTYTYQSLLPS